MCMSKNDVHEEAWLCIVAILQAVNDYIVSDKDSI